MRIAVLASGTGSLFHAMIEQQVPIEMLLFDQHCPAIEIAERAKIPVVLVDRCDFGFPKKGWDREGFTKEVVTQLRTHAIDLVAMAGFDTILNAVMFEAYGGRVLNSHPALLPKFPGHTAVEETLASGDKKTGTTIHIATEIMDDPRFIVRQVGGIRIYPDDTKDSLHERIKKAERRLYPEVLFGVLGGEIDLDEIMEHPREYPNEE